MFTINFHHLALPYHEFYILGVLQITTIFIAWKELRGLTQPRYDAMFLLESWQLAWRHILLMNLCHKNCRLDYAPGIPSY